MTKHTLDFRVVCDIVVSLEDAQQARHRDGKCVWSWCSQGPHNWIEPGIRVADVIAYLVVRTPIAIPPDAEEYLPSNNDSSDDMPSPTLPDLRPHGPQGPAQWRGRKETTHDD